MIRIINNCSICHNTVGTGTWHFGAGIYNQTNANCTINNSSICYNQINGGTWSEGGGIYNDGTLMVNNSNISHNVITSTASWTYGAGVCISRATCSLNNCTIANNIINGGSRTNGGGVYNDGTCYINNCTIALNSITKTTSGGWTPTGGGLYIASYSSGSVIVKNSILADNKASGSTNDYSGTITSYGYNIVRQSPATAFTATADQVGVNPLIDTLNNNGGPTLTMALNNSSPAIDAAAKTDIFGSLVLNDQRNSKRYNTNDIGAYEKNNSVEQITDNICSNFQDQPIIQIILFSVDTATVTSFTLTTTGTTATSEVHSARLYYTGTSTTFSTANTFGSIYYTPNGSFTITDSIRFRGINNFWLAYDIDSTAVPGHNFDASVTQIHIDTFTYIPDITDPAGYRTIPVVTAAFQINDSTQCFKGNKFIFSNNSTTTSGVLKNHWYFGDGVDSTSTSPSHYYLYPDSFAVKLVVRIVDGCADSVIKNIVVFPEPKAKIFVKDTVQCFYSNLFNFTDSSRISSGWIDSCFWNFGDNSFSRAKTVQHAYLTADTFTVRLVALSNNGCRDTNYHKVYVLPKPIASFAVNDTIQCLYGNKFFFTNNSSVITGKKLLYLWDFGDNYSDTLKNPTHSYLKTDTFLIKLIAATSIGCSDTFSQNIIVNPSSQSLFSINDSVQCFKNNQFLFTNLSYTMPSSHFIWFFGDGDTDTSANSFHSYSNIGTYKVHLVTIDANGCIDTSTHYAVITPIPKADFLINDSNQCLNGNLFQFQDISTGVPFHSSGWYFGDGNYDSIKTPSHSYTKRGNYSVKLVVTFDFSCFDTLIKSVTVKPSPITAFTVNDSTQCLKGNSFTFVNKSSIDTGSLSYNWDFGDLINSTLTNPLHSYTNPDTFRVTLTTTSSQACSSSSTATMIVFPQPKTSIIVDDTVQCFNGNLFSFHPALLNPLSNYLWDFGDGNSINSAEPDHHYLTTGNYHVILKETNQFSCVDTGWKDVFVAISPIAAISVNDSVQCINGNLFIFNSSGTPSMKSYQWIFGDGNIGTGSSVSHSYLAENTFIAKLIVTSNQDCVDTAFKNVITQPKPKADFIINDSSQCLVGNSFIFNNQSDILSVLFDWSFGDGNYTGTTNSIHSYLTSGKFPVKLKVTSKELCTDSILKWVNVKPNPSTPEVSSNSPVCLGDEINLQATSSEKVDYKWTSDHGFSSIIQNPVISHAHFTDSGEYAAKAVLDGCESGTAKLYINILPLPNLDLGEDMVFCTGDQKILDPGDFQDYLWQDNSTSRTFTVTDPGTYFVTVTGENQCKNTDTIHLISRCPTQVFIPAAFTPTGDNHNETFRIVISNIIDYHLIIYDRWGEEIFSSNNPATTWDGKYKGIICQTGYYYYSLTYLAELGGIKVLNGRVLLMR